MFYYDSLIIGRVPKKIKDRTRENMEVYNMCLSDSFEEAVPAEYRNDKSF